MRHVGRGRILCVGETMAMVTSCMKKSLRHAESFTISAGGAESNVAGYLASAGFDVAWASRLGADSLGDRIAEELEARNIDLRYVVRDSRASTGVYFKDAIPVAGRPAVSYYRSGSAASLMSPKDVESWDLGSIRWCHTTGITAVLSAESRDMVGSILTAGREHDFGVSFDVNYRPALVNPSVAAACYSELGNLAAVVFVGLDEARALWDVAITEDVATVFPKVPLVVVKDGSREACALIRSARGVSAVRVPARRVEVLEEVGAGDAFAAGFLMRHLTGATFEECLENGHRIAAWVLGSLEDYRPLSPDFVREERSD